MNDIAFMLKPASGISGKVTDAAGAGVARATVLALQPIYQRGKKEYIPLASAATGPSGDYKLEGLGTGAYLLAANEGGGVTTWYPSATSPSTADAVAVASGGEQTGKDIRLVTVPTHRVAGSIAGSGKAAIAWLTPKGGATSLIARAPAKIHPDGGFVFPHVAAGAYVLSATEEDGVTAAAAPTPVTVAQKDVDGIALHAQAGEELDGEIPVAANSAFPPGIEVILEASDAPQPRQARAEVDEHGKFRFQKLAAGHYAVHVLAPESFFVRSLRYRSTDVLESGFDFGANPAVLLIGLSTGGGSLSGNVRGPDGATMPGATVALIPTFRRFSRYKEVTTDQFGEFHFDGIAPGDYRVYAFDHIDTGVYQDAEWLKKFEFKGQPFTAKPGGHETIALRAIQ